MKKRYLFISLGLVLIGIFAILTLFFSGNEQFNCIRADGTWKTLANSCSKTCEFRRNPGEVACAQVLTEGCDCGDDKCWNGKTCEAI